MKRIISLQNPAIIAAGKLGSTRQRYKQKQYSAEGLRIISTLIEAKQDLIQLYATESVLDQAEKMADDNLITLTSDEALSKISQSKTPSGLVGIFKLPQPSTQELTSGLVLSEVSDPGNMGTLIRTCAAMGKKTVVTIGGVDPWNAKVIQASAGTIGFVNIVQFSWEQLLQQKKDLLLCGLVVKDGQSLAELNLKNALLVIGNEAHGIEQKWLEKCDNLITLKMPGGTESLNAAVAGSIAMYNAWIDK